MASMVDFIRQMSTEENQKDYAITPSKDAMRKFQTYLLRKNKNYKPVIIDPEILECPKNTTQKGKLLSIYIKKRTYAMLSLDK